MITKQNYRSAAPILLLVLGLIGGNALALNESTGNPTAPVPSSSPTPSSGSENANPAVENLRKYSLDLSVPESPAFTVLGTTPEQVTRPTSPRDFALAVAQGVDKNGKLASGLAIDLNPYMLLYGNELSLNAYKEKENHTTRIIANTQVSIGTTQANEDKDKSLRVGLGLQSTIWDKGDPRMDETFQKCLKDLTDNLFSTPPPSLNIGNKSPIDEVAKEKRRQEFKNAGTPCYNVAAKKNWNKSAWIIGLGSSWHSDDGSTSNMTKSARGLWSSVSYGFDGIPGLENDALLILHGRRLLGERAPDPNLAGAFLEQNSTVYGARIRTGSSDFGTSVESSYTYINYAGGVKDHVRRFAIGMEYKISNNTWFVATIGGEGGRQNGVNKSFVLSGLKFGSAAEPSLPQ